MILIYICKGDTDRVPVGEFEACTATVDWEVEESGTRRRAHSKNRGVVK
jgi:hypothetical protein